MKRSLTLIVLFSLMINGALAGQVDTECSAMKEENSRSNPKEVKSSGQDKASSQQATKQ